MIDPRDVTIAAATGLEAAAIRRECPQLRVVECGIALAKSDAAPLGDVIVSCGLAGGLTRSLPTGTVLIPREVERPTGERITCDTELQRVLAESAMRLGLEPVEAPMITSATIVRGSDRERLAARGYAGVDMESGLLNASRIGVVRVILDTPVHELSAAWLHPGKALMNPANWLEALWLARTAPRCARRAAQVVWGAFTP